MKLPVWPTPTKPLEEIPSNKSAFKLVTTIVVWALVALRVLTVNVLPTDKLPVTLPLPVIVILVVVTPAEKFWSAVQVLAEAKLRPKV